MSKWDEQFGPVLAQGREVREGQRILGNAIIDVIEKGGHLLAEASTGTGKSFATLIPVISAIQKNKAQNKPYRAIVSTETLTLQDQIFLKDLPFLAKLYPGFTYAKLMGRSNYLCFEAADANKVGVGSLNSLVEKLKGRADNLANGEKSDVERVIGRKLQNEEWAKLTGSSAFCGDNQCTSEVCFGSKARAKAKEVDIVVANHAILATDLEIRANATSDAVATEGLLGGYEALIVDEGHQLAPVLTEQWTKELTMWELNTSSASVLAAIEHAQLVSSNASIGRITQETVEDVVDVFKSIQNFYSLLSEFNGEKWKGSTHAVCLKYLTGRPPQYMINAMNEYEQQNPIRLAGAEEVLEKALDYLNKAMAKAIVEKLKKRRKIGKGIRAVNDLLGTVRILSKALPTDDGIISEYGAFGASVKGWEKRDGTQGMTLRLRPLDVAGRAQTLWHTRSSIVVSATLTDLTDGSFRYAKACIGFPPAAKELRVTTPFALETQQKFYMTSGKGKRVDHLRGAQFDFSEMESAINAARGRSLVLFTSREELDWASQEFRSLQSMGRFPYPILVQEKDSDKAELMEQFKSVTDSVLFATKSFFVGIDVPGEALSAVWMAKWTNPQYDAECKQQVIYWRKRGFSRWYERESLTIFQQASGRLIRSSGCKGVVGVLDFRVSDTGSNVHKTAKIGVKAQGSPVTMDMKEVASFLAA